MPNVIVFGSDDVSINALQYHCMINPNRLEFTYDVNIRIIFQFQQMQNDLTYDKCLLGDSLKRCDNAMINLKSSQFQILWG